MKYSVLMSVYKKDNPDFLKLALESIYEGQTRKPDEVVVVFDGPLTERQYAVLDGFKQGKENIVFYYPQPENKGLGEALRIGAEKCTGEYIFRMDSDDISDGRRFEKQMAYIELHPEIDVLGSNIAEFDSSLDENMRVRVCPEYHDDIVEMSKRRNPMNHMSVCVKRSALEKCGGYKPLMLMEDYFLWLRMIASGCRLANINESLIYARTGNGFYSRRGAKEQIKSRGRLQAFMLEHHMIGRLDAVINMAYIIGFTYCPKGVKKFVYDKFLRK